jgi:putative transcriptional regulator
MKITAFVTRSIGILLVVLGCAAGAASAADLSQPITLVATPSLSDSEFRQTVLFAAPMPNGMHIGFIVNRPSEVALATAFPEHPPSRKVVDPVYFGGPVMPEMLYAAVRTPPENTGNLLQLMPGVVLVMDGDAIDHIIETTPNDARYFIGLIVWQPGELDEEVRAGAWDVKPADAGTVFSAQPETLWKMLSLPDGRLEARLPEDRVQRLFAAME